MIKLKEIRDTLKALPQITDVIEKITDTMKDQSEGITHIAHGLDVTAKTSINQDKAIRELVQVVGNMNALINLQERRIQELEFEKKLRMLGNENKVKINKYSN